MKNISRQCALFVGFLLMIGCVDASLARAASSLTIYPYTISSGNPDATSATITWQTNLAGISSLSYGLTPSYGTASSTFVSGITHTLTLTGLTPATTYHYQLSSSDSNGDIATSTDQTFTTVNSCTYYVDSVNGSDSNNGTDANTPLQHLTAVPALTANGQSICLRRGSTFKDFLVVGRNGTTSGPNGNGTVNNVTIRDYGPANLSMPLIDNSDVIPPSSWSLVSGTADLYQATVPGPGTSTTTSYGTWTNSSASMAVNVFECKTAPCTPQGAGGDDDFMYMASSQSAASSTPGGFYISGQVFGSNGPTSISGYTIYMHPSDGTSPITNAYTYSYSNRVVGVSVYGLNPVVENIAVKKSAGNGGGFDIDSLDGSSATFINIEADQDGKHNMLCSGGCTVTNSKFIDEYYSFGNMFVAFDQNGSGLPITLNNDTFIQGVPNGEDNVTALYSHVGSGNLFSSFNVNGGLFEALSGVLGGWGGTAYAANNLNVTGLTCIGGSSCITTTSTSTVSNAQDISLVSGQGQLLSVGAGNSAVSVALSAACLNQSHSTVGNDSGYNNAALSIASSTFFNVSGSGNYAVAQGGTGSTLSLFNTIIDSAQSFSNAMTGVSTSTYLGDYNHFVLPNISKVQYPFTFAQWIGGMSASQDSHSVTTSPSPNAQTIACTPHQLNFTGPSSGTVNASSTSFTVTPNVSYNSMGQQIGYVGTVMVTPSGTAAAGLLPITLTFPASASTTAQTFTIAPVATGSIALSMFANGATTSPSFLASTTLTYTSNITAPSAPYGTPVATAGNTAATVSWNAPLSIGGSAIISYTVTSSPGNFSSTTSGTSATLTGLTNGTPYTFTVTATNAAGTSASSTVSNSITPSTLPVLTTGAASSITTNSAILSGAIASTSGSNPTDSGFIYSTDPTLSTGIATSSLGAQTGTTTLTATLSSLTCNTAYYFESYAINVSGTGFGTKQNFTTSACPVTTTPAVTYASDIGGTVSASDLASLLAPGAATTAYLNSLKGIPTKAGAVQASSTSGLTFTRYLLIGDTGIDVKALQTYLNTHGYVITTSGLGSPGHETTTFGSLTKKALMKFQKAHGLPSTGYFGPMTEGVIS